MGAAEERGESFLRATQHSLAVQLAVVHDFVAGLVVNTLDSAAHPAKPTHVAADGGWGWGWGGEDGNTRTHTHKSKAQVVQQKSQPLLPIEPKNEPKNGSCYSVSDSGVDPAGFVHKGKESFPTPPQPPGIASLPHR